MTGPVHRLAFAAAHVAMTDAYAACPFAGEDVAAVESHVDWPSTMAIRRRLDSLGFGVAEAMDTAQRFDLGWPVARELIDMTGALVELADGVGFGAEGLARADEARSERRDPRVIEAERKVLKAARTAKAAMPSGRNFH